MKSKIPYEIEGNDIVMDILLRTQKVSNLSDENMFIVEREFRHVCGGEHYYVAKEMKRRPQEKERIKEKLRRHNIAEIAKTEGISRRTLYRMLKEKQTEQANK